MVSSRYESGYLLCSNVGCSNNFACWHCVVDRNIYKPLVIVGVDDSVDDGNVQYDIEMTSSSKDPNYDKIQHSIKVTNVDNDVFGFSVSDSMFTVTECDTIGCADNSAPASTMISLDSMYVACVRLVGQTLLCLVSLFVVT